MSRWELEDFMKFARMRLTFTAMAALALAAVATWRLQPAWAQEPEPIAVIGHGAFFDQDGKQIPVTLEFAARVQAWYRNRLRADLSAGKKREFDAFDRRLKAGLNVQGQDLLLLDHHALEWLLTSSTQDVPKRRMGAKLRALRSEMTWRLPAQAESKETSRSERFTPNPEVQKRLDSPQFKILPPKAENARPRRNADVAEAVTANSGQAYLDECRAAGVPIPPTINVMDPAGVAGWKSQGFIPKGKVEPPVTTPPTPPGGQFIEGTPAEVRTFKSTSPEGLCIALPRYTNDSKTEVMLDGVICLGRRSSKVCFWDNQMTATPSAGNGMRFDFPAGMQIPIGVPSTPGGRYQGGGKEIEFGTGGVCTDCHAGENPFIIHPRTNLAEPPASPVTWESLSGPPQNLPTMSVNRYDPIVGASWPQNQWSQADSTVPSQCSSCHFKGSAGRFPHLSNRLDGSAGYCKVILRLAIDHTMPPGGSSAAIKAAAHAFRNTYCAMPPNSSTADTGEPHLTTTNGIHYDFQAVGEFTALRNSDTGFELQTRQSPVLTNYTLGPNPHTGLGGCVSFNSAVALRAGKTRVTYQPGRERMQLSIDGKAVDLSNRLDLGGGSVIQRGTQAGQLDVRLSDGTRVLVTPHAWQFGYSYLDVTVSNTPAREGLMGPILAGDWLPRAPDGSGFGPRPIALPDRHVVLNQKFADAWRVNGGNSLFDYPTGMNTADFTDRNWPPAPGQGCTVTTVRNPPPVAKEPQAELAKRACRGIRDKAIMADCLLDVSVFGKADAAKVHLQADKLKTAQ